MWSTSNRGERLPRNWRRIRAIVLERAGYRCEWIRIDTGERCTEVATDVDHILAGDNHSLNNLQALCRYHHAKDRKSTRLNSSHVKISYAVFCLKNKKKRRAARIKD